MKNIPEALAILFYVMIGIFSIILFLFITLPTEKKLDCSIAEISPDFSQQDREHCRKARMHKHLL
jgi:hypothetical protein